MSRTNRILIIIDGIGTNNLILANTSMMENHRISN